MPYNKMLSRNYRASQAAHSIVVDESRCSGRTTAIILAALAAAINRPGTWVHLIDHSGYTHTHHTRNNLLEQASRMSSTLGLKHFEGKPAVAEGSRQGLSHPEIRFTFLTDNQWEIT